MSFSWITLTGIDIGVLSISLIGLWVFKKWFDKRLEAQKEAHKVEYNSLREEYNSLKSEFKAFQSASDQRYAALRKENEELKKENRFLRKEVTRQADEIDELKQAFYGLKGRYDELKELLNRLIAKL